MITRTKEYNPNKIKVAKLWGKSIRWSIIQNVGYFEMGSKGPRSLSLRGPNRRGRGPVLNPDPTCPALSFFRDLSSCIQ